MTDKPLEKLTDEEIHQLLMDLQGWEGSDGKALMDSSVEQLSAYEPTANTMQGRSQCLGLIEKHDVWVSSDEGKKIASCAPHSNGSIREHDFFQRAVCEAIIVKLRRK